MSLETEGTLAYKFQPKIKRRGFSRWHQMCELCSVWEQKSDGRDAEETEGEPKLFRGWSGGYAKLGSRKCEMEMGSALDKGQDK